MRNRLHAKSFVSTKRRVKKIDLTGKKLHMASFVSPRYQKKTFRKVKKVRKRIKTARKKSRYLTGKSKKKTYSSHYAKKCMRKKRIIQKRITKKKPKNDSEFEQRIEEIENNITKL